MGIWMLLFSECLKMFTVINKIVKALKPSKDSELARVGRVLRCSHRHPRPVFARDALSRVKANDKGYRKSSNLNYYIIKERKKT